jgi:hypothetical protein
VQGTSENVTFGALLRLAGASMVATMENITTPARRALAALDKPAPGDGAAGMPRRISKKVTAAIDLMVSGECKKITEAA